MKKTRLKSLIALLIFALLPGFGHSEDIDLYTGDTSGGGANVLLVLDNSTNWGGTMNNSPSAEETTFCGAQDTGTFFCAQKLALVKLLKMKDPKDSTKFLIRPTTGVGLMLYTEKKSGPTEPGVLLGGYMRFGVRKMSGDETTGNRGALIKLLQNFDKSGDQAASSTENYAYLMWEAFKYYGGGTGTSPISDAAWGPVPYAGVLGGTTKRDYPSNNMPGSATWAGADTNYALTSSAQDGTARYTSPITDPCGKNYIILTSTSASQDSDNNDNSPTNSYWKAVGSKMNRVVDASGTEITGSFADEATRYMFNSDVYGALAGVQNIITHTIAQYNPNNSGNKGNRDKMITQMTSMATQGGGSFYTATSVDQLLVVFSDIVTTIQATDSVFVSAALPVSVSTQGTYLNQVFIGMFRPDGAGSPKWLGNLKQYKLKYDATSNTLRLVDSSGTLNAIDPSTGFITALAKSFWTTDSTFWTNWVPGRTSSASDLPDGPEVQKGGAAQRLREDNLTTQANRKAYTCPVDSTGSANCSVGSLSAAPFNTTTLSPSSTGTQLAFNYPAAWKTATTASTDLTNLIAWARGTDNLGDELGPGSGTTVRPTLHGDVLHSLPVALNHAGRVVVYYASNDGMLHAVEGKQTGSGAGSELWSFVAPENFNKLQRLRQRAPEVELPSSTTHTTCLATDVVCNKSYFFDGPIGAYQEGSTAIIYVAARRGGNFIYAIDVSNPDDPQYKFKISQSTSGMSLLGQTWSVPKVMKVRDGGTGRVVLIFGGGYDPAEDTDTAGTTGRGVYVVDAKTGVLIKQFLTAVNGTDVISTPVPADVGIVDADRDGFIDRAYFGDLAGNIWRIDLDDGSATNPSSGWNLYKLASLGTRKFFYPPDVVFTTNFSAVLIGSGDREKPLLTSSADRVYMIKDANPNRILTSPTVIAQTDLVVNTTATTDPTGFAAAKGWYYDLRAGEKVENGPLTVGGVVYFGTNRPDATLACKANLGEARSYALDFLNGGGTRPPDGTNAGDDAYSLVLTGGGLPPPPVAGMVDLGGGQVVPFCLGCGALRSPLEALVPDVDPSPVRKKIYWKIKNDT